MASLTQIDQIQPKSERKLCEVIFTRALRLDHFVGEKFGIEKYSTVSRIVESVKYGMKGDKGLKNRIQKLAEKSAKSQRQT